MIKLYFKQAWAMVKQNKLFSSIYMLGTGLAIATTMIMAIVYYVKIAPIYPEVNRSRTLYMNQSYFQNKDMNSLMGWAFSCKAAEEWFYQLKNAEAVSAIYTISSGAGSNYIQPFDGSGDFGVRKKLTDTGFFRIYRFRFIEGKPFTEADLASGIRSAVITDKLARRIFNTDRDVVGKTIKLNYLDYRIAGVVEAPSNLISSSYADVYAPYSSQKGYDRSQGSDGLEYYGAYNIILLAKSAEQVEALRQEVKEVVRKFNLSDAKWELNIFDQPTTHLTSVFQANVSEEFSWMNIIRHYLLIVLVLLLVPALNLSGMIAGRMDARLSEMGVRKSFGAWRNKLLGQVIWENLILTLIGGLLGLILAWTILFLFRDWVFALLETNQMALIKQTEVEVSAEMLFAPAVFVAALLLCVVLNLLSALIPAWYSLRNPIIKSLNEKR